MCKKGRKKNNVMSNIEYKTKAYSVYMFIYLS